MRIVAWGQPSEHSPHCVQIFGSQMGMSWAMLRFSYCVVAVGNVPSQGSALTGRSSPRLAIIMPSTSLTNAGAWAGHRRHHVQLRGDLAGILHLVQRGQGAVDRRVVLLDDLAAPLLAVGVLDGVLDLRDGLVGRNHAWPA